MRIESYWPGNRSDDEVHVWHLVIQDHSQTIMNGQACLSTQEIARSDQFKFDKDRIFYLTSHILLRKVLACYLNIACNQIKFIENGYGKPIIVDT
jgi:phosphopantetheinyl transferase